MRSSLGPRLALAGLLFASLALKLSEHSEPSMDRQNEVVRSQLQGFLARRGFEEDQSIGITSPVLVSGQSGSCRLLIINAAPDGWHRDMPSRYAGKDDLSFFVFRAKRYPQQPVWLTRADHYWKLRAESVGLHEPVNLVLGVVASAACDVDRMHWDELATLARMDAPGGRQPGRQEPHGT